MIPNLPPVNSQMIRNCLPLNSQMLPNLLLLTHRGSLTAFLLTHSSVQSLSRVPFFVTPWTAARQASLSISNSRSLLKLMSTELVMPSNHLILCRPLLLPPSIFPSIRVFSNESALRIRWPKYWSFSLSPSNEYSGLISFRMDWWDLLAVAFLLTHSRSLTAFLLTPRGCLTSLWEPLPPALGAPAGDAGAGALLRAPGSAQIPRSGDTDAQ